MGFVKQLTPPLHCVSFKKCREKANGAKVGRGTDSSFSLTACFVEAALADVAHPLDDVVVAVVEFGLEHLEVAHLEARRREGNLWI